jgi:hypothetical protein
MPHSFSLTTFINVTQLVYFENIPERPIILSLKMIKKSISRTFHVFPFLLETTYNITKCDTKMYIPIYGPKWIDIYIYIRMLFMKFELNLLDENEINTKIGIL